MRKREREREPNYGKERDSLSEARRRTSGVGHIGRRTWPAGERREGGRKEAAGSGVEMAQEDNIIPE